MSLDKTVTFCPPGVAYLDEQSDFDCGSPIEEEYERINVENIDIAEMVTKTKSMSPGSSCFIILQHEFSIIVSMWFNDYHGYQGHIVTEVGNAFKCSYEELDGVLMYMNYKGWCLGELLDHDYISRFDLETL
ncbi:hypothetical protein H4R99_006326 [Coemansia sp. RSA 1722]|nr:hypothetical protein IWW45_006991 [Coemansia sp. RSA 485]KAJ2592698.1 hypothetical protein H4R99_006326 [Coemansia sp. RSA 1722]